MAGYMRLIPGTTDKYQFEVSHGFDAKGKRKKFYRTEIIKHKKDATAEEIEEKAKKALAVFEHEVKEKEVTKPTHYTFATYVEKWRESDKYRKLAPKTALRYNELLRLHIIPAIGAYKLEDITSEVLDDAYNEFRKPQKRTYTKKDGTTWTKEYTLSERTVHHCHRVISIILNRAMEKKLIKENPLLGVDVPAPEDKEAKCYTETLVDTMFDALESEDFQFKTLIHLLYNSGCRIGEIMGLTWDNVDFDNNTIEIRQASQYLPGRGTFMKDNPKNETSKRTVGIPDAVMDMLSELLHEQKVRKVELGNKWVNTNLVFSNPDGSQIHTYTPGKQFSKFIKRHNLPQITIHGLRHTSGSALLDAGESFGDVAKRLGHANTAMLIKRYGHKFKDNDKSAVDKLSKRYDKKSESEAK